jgi:hypothetical protein
MENGKFLKFVKGIDETWFYFCGCLIVEEEDSCRLEAGKPEGVD